MTRPLGYRELSVEERELINQAKVIEAFFNSLIDELRSHPECDQRQVSIAQTDGESAFMRAVRSIARPDRLTADKE